MLNIPKSHIHFTYLQNFNIYHKANKIQTYLENLKYSQKQNTLHMSNILQHFVVSYIIIINGHTYHI